MCVVSLPRSASGSPPTPRGVHGRHGSLANQRPVYGQSALPGEEAFSKSWRSSAAAELSLCVCVSSTVTLCLANILDAQIG